MQHNVFAEKTQILASVERNLKCLRQNCCILKKLQQMYHGLEFCDKLRFYHTNRMAQVTWPHKSIVLRPSKLRIDDQKLRTEHWGPRTEDQELKTGD